MIAYVVAINSSLPRLWMVYELLMSFDNSSIVFQSRTLICYARWVDYYLHSYAYYVMCIKLWFLAILKYLIADGNSIVWYPAASRFWYLNVNRKHNLILQAITSPNPSPLQQNSSLGYDITMLVKCSIVFYPLASDRTSGWIMYYNQSIKLIVFIEMFYINIMDHHHHHHWVLCFFFFYK